jgi:hypothetical protein
MLQRTDATPAARPKTSSKKHMKALTMKFDPPDTSLKDYKKRRSAFLNELIASTPNVSARAKEFRRWIDENSPYSDNTKPKTLRRPGQGGLRVVPGFCREDDAGKVIEPIGTTDQAASLARM